MDELRAELKKHGWSDELLNSIEKVSRALPSGSISSQVMPRKEVTFDLHSISLRSSDITDSSTLIIKA